MRIDAARLTCPADERRDAHLLCEAGLRREGLAEMRGKVAALARRRHRVCGHRGVKVAYKAIEINVLDVAFDDFLDLRKTGLAQRIHVPIALADLGACVKTQRPVSVPVSRTVLNHCSRDPRSAFDPSLSCRHNAVPLVT